MDTGWIQVFVLTLSECVAPEGKTVCQAQAFDLQFVEREECELALRQLVELKNRVDDVIVDTAASRCTATARQRTVYANLADISAAHAGSEDWQAPESGQPEGRVVNEAHAERLARLPDCSENGRVPPCKVGNIIVEEDAPQAIEVWRKDR